MHPYQPLAKERIYDRCLWQCAREEGFEPSSLAAVSLEPGLEIIREDYCSRALPFIWGSVWGEEASREKAP